MGFASGYLEQRTLFPELIKEAPDKNTGIIVVVPAYDEPGIARLLDSLAKCSAVPCGIEILVIVNAPASASRESLANNILAIGNINSWKSENSQAFFRLYPVELSPSCHSSWGVGMARKTGMDEAVRRFDSIDMPGGIILNLDADCTVDSNYFESVYNGFLLRKERSACSIYFEHPVSGSDFTENIYRYIVLYELHLRYYYQGLLFSGYPEVFHTVGSATGVRALTYVRAGGMNRKQAGEDFYFIQKLIPAGGYFSLNSTAVRPSPRPSFRVPFGTGAAIARLSENKEPVLLTYNVDAFRELKEFFGLIVNVAGSGPAGFDAIYKSLPVGMRSFLGEAEFHDRLAEIRNNTAGEQSFRKRFFGWFNMFRIVKYLNHVHAEIYQKRTVDAEASKLLSELGMFPGSLDAVKLLDHYRKMEKGN